jgi:hypothetical protein
MQSTNQSRPPQSAAPSESLVREGQFVYNLNKPQTPEFLDQFQKAWEEKKLSAGKSE